RRLARLHDGDDLRAAGEREGRHRGLVLELGLLRGQSLDLASGVGETGLDLEEIGDLRRLLGVADEGGLARLEIPDPSGDVDDLAGDLRRVGLLRDLRAQGAKRVEGVLPASDGDAVRHGRDRLVVASLLLRAADVAAEAPDG